MKEKHTNRNRREVLHALCCGGVAGFSGLVHAQSIAPARVRRVDAWLAAQEDIAQARGMTERITTSIDGLTTTAASAITLKEKALLEIADVSGKMSKLTTDRDRLLEEYRNGLFCSGCDQTKSQILAKGETFPHSGQRIIAPTQAQIEQKARELQAPITRAERALATAQKQKSESEATADIAFQQIRAGLALWSTATTFWRSALQNGQRERELQLRRETSEFQTAFNSELQRQVTRTGNENDAQVQADANMWKRLLDKQASDIEKFNTQSRKASLDFRERNGAQQIALRNYLQKPPLPTSMLAAVVRDAPMSRGLSDHELGMNYHLGAMDVFLKSHSGALPPPLPPVAQLISRFRAAGHFESSDSSATTDRVAPTPNRVEPAQDNAVSSATTANNRRLLRPLP